jgi:hypothetical protein
MADDDAALAVFKAAVFAASSAMTAAAFALAALSRAD